MADRDALRLAEIVAALSLATDLGMGQPMEHELRTCLLAVELGESLGLGERTLAETYYVALLRWIGCTSHAHELAGWFDDELAAHGRAAALDFGRPADVLGDLLRHAGAGRPAHRRAATVAGALATGRGAVADLFAAPAASTATPSSPPRDIGWADGARGRAVSRRARSRSYDSSRAASPTGRSRPCWSSRRGRRATTCSTCTGRSASRRARRRRCSRSSTISSAPKDGPNDR